MVSVRLYLGRGAGQQKPHPKPREPCNRVMAGSGPSDWSGRSGCQDS